MALICRRCGVELVSPQPFFVDRQRAEELGSKANGDSWFGWHVEPATDVIWDEAVCIEGMDPTWMRKVNGEVETPLDRLQHVPVKVDLLGWSECDGKGDDGRVSGAIEVRQVDGSERRD